MEKKQFHKQKSESDDISASSAESHSNSSQEIQPASPSPTHHVHFRSQTSHTSVSISDDSPVENRGDSYYQWLGVAILALIISLIIICSLTIAATATLPLLLLSFFFLRLLQFFSHGDAYDKAVQLKFYIRTLILLDMIVFLLILWAFYSVPKNASGVKHVMLLELTLTNWVSIYHTMFGIYLFSCVVAVITINLIPSVPLDHSKSGLNVADSILEIFDCLIFLLAESKVMKRVPVLQQHTILGLYTRKWIEVTISTLIAYNAITLSTHMIVWLLRNLVSQNIFNPGAKGAKSLKFFIIHKLLRRRYLVYWANGMKSSINFILSSLLFLLTWVCYFGSHLNRTLPQVRKIIEFGTWTFVSLLICSFIWLVKTCVLLSWEASSVYNRLESRILQGGEQLLYLGIIGRHKHDILNLLYECKDESIWDIDNDNRNLIKLISKLSCNTDDVDGDGDEYDTVKKLWRRQMIKVKNELLMEEGRIPTLYCLQQTAGYFLTSKETLLKENYTSDILEVLNIYSPDDEKRDIKARLKELIQVANECTEVGNDTSAETSNLSEGPPLKKKDVWESFEIQMKEYVGSSQEIPLEKFRMWMERAHNNGLFLANTLSSAKEVVDCLNKIISWLLIVATFIMWLLLTGLATTTILVVIASPLLAATFIFGDACKTLFQGIMFAYVVHPFHVGDLCLIDEKLMEVKTIGVWKTTFSTVGMKEEVIYPNLELSNKNLINYKTDFDWNDYVEVDVASLGEEKIKILKQEIEKHLDVEKTRFTPGYNSIQVLTNGANIKIAINFKHEVNLKNSTYFECLKEKRKLRSDFILHAESLLNHMKYEKSKTSENHEEMIKARNGSLTHRPNSGDDTTFTAGMIEGIYGG